MELEMEKIEEKDEARVQNFQLQGLKAGLSVSTVVLAKSKPESAGMLRTNVSA